MSGTRFYKMSEMMRHRILAKRKKRISEQQQASVMRSIVFDTRDDVYCKRCNIVLADMVDVVAKKSTVNRVNHYHEHCARAVNIIV